ncbi:MAG: DUF2442 domain-containing protein [Caldilineaceae bacterium]|nr:DUF2442 domain-containing protein [Caldilineaceae bacterium]
MTTLSKLYLGSEPVGVEVKDDQLNILLADEQSVALPLQIISQLHSDEPIPAETQVLLLRHPPRIDHVHVTDHALNVYLTDGRLLSSPLAWFPRLLHGTRTERNHYVLSGDDDVIHWPDLDEDIHLLRLFEGGKSVESEPSIQHWLHARRQHASAQPPVPAAS